MTQQPHRLRVRLLKWLLYSSLSLFYLVGVPATGLAIESDDSMVSLLDERLKGAPEILDELWLNAPSKQVQTLVWHEGLLEILSDRGVSRQVRQAPVPSVESICTSLDVILSEFDLDAEQLPDRLREQLCQRVRNYAVRYRRDVQAMLYRADDYLPMIKRTLREYGLPTYFAYVPLVESAFQADARHGGSGARGLWQLLRDTARARGLTVSKAVDERLHPRRSTEAAVSYLAYLYQRFGDHGPLYILAAYNYGETNLSRKMRRFHPPSIASLYQPGCLPAETREYFLRMMTMWVLVARPGRFHLLLREAADPSVPFHEIAPRRDAPVGVAESGDIKAP